MLMQRVRHLAHRIAPGRRTQRGGSAALLTLAVVSGLVLLNVLGARHHRRWDLTRARSFSLAPDTVQVLAGLRQDVDVVAFPETGSGLQAYFADLVKEYAYRAGGHLHYRFVDPDAEPGVAQQYGVAAYNTVVVTSGKRQEKIDAWDLSAAPGADGQPQWGGENALTNAILRATQTRVRKVYLLQGHQEHDADLGAVRKGLADAGYTVANLSLLDQAAVPGDADALVIGGPRRDLSQPEAEAIGRWAEQGGHLLLMADPVPEALPNLAALAARLGVKFGSDTVLDPAAHYRFDPTALVPSYEEHAITGKTQASQMRMLLPGARSLTLLGGGWEATPLLTTSGQAWGQTDTAGGRQRYDAVRGDVKGPLQLAAALERPAAPGKPALRNVVIGSAAFATDATVRLTAANLDFILESLAWLTESGGVTIKPRPAESARLFLTGGQARVVLYGPAVALPLTVFLAGGAVWLRRRHL